MAKPKTITSVVWCGITFSVGDEIVFTDNDMSYTISHFFYDKRDKEYVAALDPSYLCFIQEDIETNIVKKT